MSFQYQHSKINTTAQTRLKEYQLLNVHDNFMTSVDQYLNCNKKDVNVEQDYRTKLINQSNIIQPFFETLLHQLDPSEIGTILARIETISQQLQQIPKYNKFINGLVQNYKQCLLQNKTKLVEFPNNLKKEATNEQKILVDIVYRISKTRNQDHIMPENFTNTKYIPRQSNRFAGEEKIINYIYPAQKKQINSTLYPPLYPPLYPLLYPEKIQFKPNSEYGYKLKFDTNPQNKIYKSGRKSFSTIKQTNKRMMFTRNITHNFW